MESFQMNTSRLYLRWIQKNVEVAGEKFELRLWDTAGQEAYEELRKQAYIGAHVIIIGFCLVNRDSFENVTETWMKDCSKEAKDAKVVLVGLKQDLVENVNELKKLKDKEQEPVTEEEMAAVAKKIGAASHLRCSALTGVGVNEVFESVVHAHQNPVDVIHGGGCCFDNCNILWCESIWIELSKAAAAGLCGFFSLCRSFVRIETLKFVQFSFRRSLWPPVYF